MKRRIMKDEKTVMVSTKHYAPGQLVYFLSTVEGDARKPGDHFQINKGYVSNIFLGRGF